VPLSLLVLDVEFQFLLLPYVWDWSRCEDIHRVNLPQYACGAKAASTIPVAEIFARTLGRYLAKEPSTAHSALKGTL
jgi:hypothetical protein